MTCLEVASVVSDVLATWMGGFGNTPNINLEIWNKIDASMRKSLCCQSGWQRLVTKLFSTIEQ